MDFAVYLDLHLASQPYLESQAHESYQLSGHEGLLPFSLGTDFSGNWSADYVVSTKVKSDLLSL